MNGLNNTIAWLDGYLKGVVDAAPTVCSRMLNAAMVKLDPKDLAAAYRRYLVQDSDFKELTARAQSIEIGKATPIDDWVPAMSAALAKVLHDVSDIKLQRIEWQVNEMLFGESINAGSHRNVSQACLKYGSISGTCIFVGLAGGFYLVISALVD